MVSSVKSTPQSKKEESPGKDSTKGLAEMLKIAMDNNQRTVELLLQQANRNTSEKDKLDQEDQRIKVMELDILEDATEESASIMCGDWLHRIRPVIKNKSDHQSIGRDLRT